MARHGTWQLSRLTVNFCNFSGSSKGVRQFVEELLPSFRSENPQLSVVEALRPGHHPYLKAEYRNGTVRNVGVKNESDEEILRHAMTLRSAAGRSTHVKVKERHVQPSEGGQRASASIQNALKGDNRNVGHVESWTHPPAAHAVKQDYTVDLLNRFNRGTTTQPQNMNLMKQRAVKSLGRLAHGMFSTPTAYFRLSTQGV